MSDNRPEKAWYDNKPYSPTLAKGAIERFNAHQFRLRRAGLYDRMRRAWLIYYNRDKDGGYDNSDLQLAGERGELVILKPNRFRRLVNDQLDVIRQTAPDFEPVALNTDAESQAQTQLVHSILEESGRRHNRMQRRIDAAELAALFGEGVIHGRWAGDRGRVAMIAGDGQTPIYEGDHVWSLRTPYDCAYDLTSPEPHKPRWAIVCEPEDRYELLQENEDDEEVSKAIRNAEDWSRRYMGDKMFGRDYIEHDDSIPVYYVYIWPCKLAPAGRVARIIDERIILSDSALDEATPGVFFLRPATTIIRNEGYTNNFGGLALSEAHSATISTIMSNADAFGLQRLLVAKAAGLKDVDKGAGLIYLPWEHFDAKSGQPVPEPKMLEVQPFPPELLNLEQVLSRELDTVMGGSAAMRGDPQATKGDSGSKSAMLYAAAQSVGNAFMTSVLRADADIATWEIDSYKRHASVERITAIVGKRGAETVRRWTREDLSAIDRVNVRPADASRDAFPGRMAMAEMLIPLPPNQRAEMQTFVQTGRIETITEPEDERHILLERENEAILDEKGPPPVVRPGDDHRAHIQHHLLNELDPSVRQNPAQLARNKAHIDEHVAWLTPGSPQFDENMLVLTGQTPLGLPPTSGAGAGSPGPTAPPPNSSAPPHSSTPSAAPGAGPPSGGAHAPGPGLPKPAQQPKNAATGQRLNLPPPPSPMTGGAQP